MKKGFALGRHQHHHTQGKVPAAGSVTIVPKSRFAGVFRTKKSRARDCHSSLYTFTIVWFLYQEKQF